MGTFVSGYFGKGLSLDFCSYQYKTYFMNTSQRLNSDRHRLEDSDFLPDDDKYDDSPINLSFEEGIIAHAYFSQDPTARG